MTLELGEESPVLSVEIARPEQAEAPLSTPQTVEASELGGDAVLDTSPKPVDCPEFVDDVAIRTLVPPLQPMPVDDLSPPSGSHCRSPSSRRRHACGSPGQQGHGQLRMMSSSPNGALA